MTIENGLDTPDTAKLDELLASGTLDPRVTDYLRITRAQSIGWMLHDKFLANLLRVSHPIIQKIKKAVAKLPGIRRVRFKNHRGVPYDGLLLGDHAEGEGYDIIGWYDGDVYVEGLPPALVQPFDTSTLSPTATNTPRRSRSRRHRPQAEPEEQKKPEDRVTVGNAEKRVALAEIKRRRPDLVPGCAVIDAVLDHKNTPVTEHAAENVWQGLIQSDVGAFTAREAYDAVSRIVQAGKPLTHDWVARGIRAVRRETVTA